MKEWKEKHPHNQTTSTITDIDGNVYNTIKIGNQWWMVENLKTSHYRDGTAIIEVKDNASWDDAGQSKKSAWSYYDNDAKNNSIYGKLYNWFAVIDPRGLCPAGWHLPTVDEFKLLEEYLGGRKAAGGKMKAQTLWNLPNAGADNTSGFTALPAGFRYDDGDFHGLHNIGYFWTSTEVDDNVVETAFLDKFNSDAFNYTSSKRKGLAVRCIAD
jgi:uncharacterized protein (TIGR02145 family)